MGFLADKWQALKDHSAAGTKHWTADGYLNVAELSGNEEAIARATKDRDEAIAERNEAASRLWGNLYRGPK
jgi:hypothetical protein